MPNVNPLGHQATRSFIDTELFNQTMPKQGPRTVPVTIDWSLGISQKLDLLEVQQRRFIDYCQSVFIDNKSSDYWVEIEMGTTGQTVRIPARSQAYLPILLPNPPRLTFNTETGNTGTTILQLLNFPINSMIWNANATFSFDSNGNLLVSDTALLAQLTGGTTQVQSVPRIEGSNGLVKQRFMADASGIASFSAAGTSTIYSPGTDEGWVLCALRIVATDKVDISGGGSFGVNIRDESAAAIFNTAFTFASGGPGMASGQVLADYRDLQYMAATDAHDLIAEYTGTSLSDGQVELQLSYCAQTPNRSNV